MGDDLPEKLYTAWRSSLLSAVPDLPSWGNVRDPDVRMAWEAAAGTARREVKALLVLLFSTDKRGGE